MSAGWANESTPSRQEAIEATAAVWLSLRDRGMTPSETEAFVRWLQESSDHAAAFESLNEAWEEFDRLSVLPKPGTAQDGNLLAPRYRRRLARLPMASLAAAAVFALLCVGMWQLRGRRHFAETEVGAVQSVDLPDGSVAQLNTDSAIDVDMAGSERRVRVVRGEVDFTVHHDATHPFVVSVGGVEVRDIGTAFDVRQAAGRVEVIVTEGRVQLRHVAERRTLLTSPGAPGAPTSLVAGEKAVIPTAQGSLAPAPVQVSPISSDEIHRALAWQERRLEFDATPLGQVAAEFNRYNRVHLVVADPRLAARPFSGTFRADGYEALVALLRDDFDVSVVRVGDEIRLASKPGVVGFHPRR